MHRQKSCDQESLFDMPPWSGVVYRFSRQWKIPVLVFSLGTFQPAFAYQDSPTASSATGNTVSTDESDLERSLKEAERLLGGKATADSVNADLRSSENRQLLNSAKKLGREDNRTEAFSNLARMLSNQQDFSSAREAALEIDQTALVDKTRALITVARAEETADQNENAWLTLHEAQAHALKLKKPEQLIALMREIGDVERSLRANAAADVAALQSERGDDDSQTPREEEPRGLDPEPKEVIETVLAHGLPPVAYEEVELLSEGGGPHREPRTIYHAYYYNGDRIFQGPMFPGGPTDVYVIHPRTGDKCVFRVNMPTGTPFIDKSSIEYYFPDIVVELNFRRSGGHDIDYRTLFNKYDREHRKFRDRSLRATESALGIDPASIGDRLLSIGQSGPLSIANRLPFLSNLLNRNSKRVPGTLSAPK